MPTMLLVRAWLPWAWIPVVLEVVMLPLALKQDMDHHNKPPNSTF
jgi:hypothetical protein